MHAEAQCYVCTYVLMDLRLPLVIKNKYHMYSEVSIKRTHSIKRTVGLDFQKSLLNVLYDQNLMKFITKRTVSIKRTVCKFNHIFCLKALFIPNVL